MDGRFELAPQQPYCTFGRAFPNRCSTYTLEAVSDGNIALLALAVSLITLLWQVAGYALGGRRVRAQIVSGLHDRVGNDLQEYINVLVTNKGRIPVKIDLAGVFFRPGLFPGGGIIYLAKEDLHLEPGETWRSVNLLPRMKDRLDRSESQIAWMHPWVLRSDGRRVRVRRYRFCVMTRSGFLWGPGYKVSQREENFYGFNKKWYGRRALKRQYRAEIKENSVTPAKDSIESWGTRLRSEESAKQEQGSDPAVEDGASEWGRAGDTRDSDS